MAGHDEVDRRGCLDRSRILQFVVVANRDLPMVAGTTP